MGSERQEEEISRIVNCINSCWPEVPFTYVDIRKPSGEKFRDVLSKFLKGFFVCNYQLPGVSSFHNFSYRDNFRITLFLSGQHARYV